MLGRRECAAIVAMHGDVPPELKATATRAWPRLLTITGSRDEWYTPERLESDMEFLRERRPDARKQIVEGGHEWTDGLVREVGRWLAEISPIQM
jgi:predicted esterase